MACRSVSYEQSWGLPQLLVRVVNKGSMNSLKSPEFLTKNLILDPNIVLINYNQRLHFS